jgi:uncharacterized protein RhaS with RHS repeats
MYDPQIGRWHSPDPASELYYSWSTYQYVRNNPINRIDPNGMFDYGYTIDNDGNIKKVDDTGVDKNGVNQYDVLYKKEEYEAAKTSGETNEYGNPEPENQLTVTDTDILPSLEQNNQATSITSENEAFNVFKFASDNSKVEWGLVGYEENGSNQYALYTDQGSDNLRMPQYALNLDNTQSFLHSHPRAGTTEYYENISMGRYVRPDNGQVQCFQSSDWGLKRGGLMPYKTAVYFPRTKNVYQLKLNTIVYGGKYSNYR